MTKAPPKVYARSPKDDEVKEIRRLLKKAGGEQELQSWIRFVCRKRGRGRPPGATKFADFDDRVLATAESLAVLKNVTLNRVLKAIAAKPDGPLHWNKTRGASAGAMVKRLHAKSLADRRKFNGLKKSETERLWNEFMDWLTSPGDADLKSNVKAFYLALCRARDHSD
jgi:hypothetical protein